MVWSRLSRGLTMVRLQPLSPLSVGVHDTDTWGFKCDVVVMAMFYQRGRFVVEKVTTRRPRLTRVYARVREKICWECQCTLCFWCIVIGNSDAVLLHRMPSVRKEYLPK